MGYGWYFLSDTLCRDETFATRPAGSLTSARSSSTSPSRTKDIMAQTVIQTYVQKLYQNALLRDGDTAGVSYWAEQANQGLGSIDMV